MVIERTQNGILDINKGIICHQVNCCGAIGAGVSGAIIRKYPIVGKKYTELCKRSTKYDLFGTIQPIEINDDLTIVNLFTQLNYGNSKKTGIIYTDMAKLTASLRSLLDNPDAYVYVPEYIGCGLAGGDWNEFMRIMQDTNLHIRGLS